MFTGGQPKRRPEILAKSSSVELGDVRAMNGTHPDSWEHAAYTGWRRETGEFEVDYEIPPRSQVPSARGFVTLKRLVRL
jgi:hypothetical protein